MWHFYLLVLNLIVKNVGKYSHLLQYIVTLMHININKNKMYVFIKLQHPLIIYYYNLLYLLLNFESKIVWTCSLN